MVSESSIPCIIREIFFAPESLQEESTLIEVALTHHNNSNYQLAIQTYLKAQQEWMEKMQKSGTEMNVHEFIFFRLAIGSVYHSSGNDEMALHEFVEAKRYSEQFVEKAHSDRSLPYSCLGAVYFHLGQFDLAYSYFNRARELRLTLLGSSHVDTATAYNNIAVCLHQQKKYAEALKLYNKALMIFKSDLGPNHPRTTTVVRNITKTKNLYLKDFQFNMPTFSDTVLPIEKKKAKKKGKKKGKKKKKKK